MSNTNTKGPLAMTTDRDDIKLVARLNLLGVNPAGWFNPWNEYHGYQQVAEDFEAEPGMVPLYDAAAVTAAIEALASPPSPAPAESGAVAWMTADGRVATDETKRTAMASPSRAAFNIPLFPRPPAPSASMGRVTAAKALADWLGYSWDGIPDRGSDGFPDWAYDGTGRKRYQGGKEGLLRLLAALDSPPDHSEGEGWQSIETAPKDTPILVGRGRVNLGDGTYKDGLALEAQWNTDERGWYFGGWVGGWLKVDPEHPPTHWQPLPEPPRAALRSQP